MSFLLLRLFPVVMFASLFQRDVSMVAFEFVLQFVGSTLVQRLLRCKLKVRIKVRLSKNAQKCYVISWIFLLKVHISPLQHSNVHWTKSMSCRTA